MGHLALIQEHFHLDGEDVIRTSTGKSVMGGKPNSAGYLRVKVGPRPGVSLLLHRVKFALLHGYLPGMVDHKNRSRGDLSSDNLREATHQQNMWNAPRQRQKNADLPRGVIPVGRRYRASAMSGGPTKYLGTFNTPEEASRAYQEFCHKTRGEFHDAAL